MNRTVKYVLAVGCAALLLAVAFAARAPEVAKAEDTSTRLISVTGESKLEVKPDMATLTFGVENTAKTAQEAQRENAVKMNAVIDSLLTLGIPRSNIQTSNFSLYPVYEYPKAMEGGSPVLAGYRCNNSVTVRLMDVSMVGGAIDVAVTAGATNAGNISFGLQNPENYRNAVLTAAVNDAKAKADVMARAAGVTITGVYKISDGYTSVVPVERAMASYDMVKQAPSIEPGTVNVTASVRIDFTF